MGIAYFDCFAGAGGDMIVGALLNAGANFDELEAELGKLEAGGCTLRSEVVRRGGLGGTRFCVDTAPPSGERDESGGSGAAASPGLPHRNLGEILDILKRADLSPRVTDRTDRIFTRLAEAEAKVHHIDIQEVHFHEIGALDSIMDIVGACVGLELLGIDRVCCSPIPVGTGTVECAHGVIPLPAPATAELRGGAKTVPGANPGELTTPTAAAVLTTLAESFGAIPSMQVKAIGYGAGSRDEGPIPNLLRVFVGEADEAGDTDTVVELSANIDDCTGELLGATIERLLAAGCLDAWATPIYMKKSRPAWTISALCGETDLPRAEQILFAETTTFGIRRRTMTRSKLSRVHETVETPYGPIRIKVGSRGGQEMTASPEFADCEAAAEAHHASIREVLAAAHGAWRQKERK